VFLLLWRGGPRPVFAWLAERMDRGGLQFFHSVIWDKVNPGLGWRYRRQHEMLMVAHRAGGKLLWAEGAKATPNIFPLMPPRDRCHPNEKPVPLIAHFVALHTAPGQLILDPFMGSGTTGVVAAGRGRKFIGVELDPSHFETACRRISAALSAPDMFIEKPKPIEMKPAELDL
jgi:site-specific DNA-methyltransferase (adenine-specific)